MVPIAIGSASTPDRIKLIKGSTNAAGSGWYNKFSFYTPYKKVDLASAYSVGQAYTPHRYRIFPHPNDNKETISGWSYVFQFYAFSSQQPGTIPYAVGKANSPSRFMIFRNTENAERSGWSHEFVFWAYPNRKGIWYHHLFFLYMYYQNNTHYRCINNNIIFIF